MYGIKLNIKGILLILLFMSINLLHASNIAVSPSSDRIQKFEMISVKIDLNTSFTNPYNPDDIQVDAIIKTPDGEQLILPCFYKSGPPEKSEWEAKFTPMQAGTHMYHIQVIHDQDTLLLKVYSVNDENVTWIELIRLDILM